MYFTLSFVSLFQDDTSKSSSAANELGLANVGGVFVVLMGGMGFACVIAVCEFIWKSRKVAVEERVNKLPFSYKDHNLVKDNWFGTLKPR